MTLRSLSLATAAFFIGACATSTPRAEPPPEHGGNTPDVEFATVAEAPVPPEPAPAPSPTPQRLPIVLVKGGPTSGAVLSTLIPGQKPRPLRQKVGQECAETMGIGSSSPVVSPDGRFVAFNEVRRGKYRGELVVVSLADSTVETLTQHKGDLDVCVQITGWSADGERLLFHVEDHTSEDANPVKGLIQGFFLWERGSKARHLAWLGSADLLTPDGGSVLRVVAAEPSKGRSLFRVNLGDQTAVELASQATPYAFGQLHAEGEHLAFGGGGTIEIAPFGNVKDSKTLVKRAFAEAQWPRLSPDGRHLAWQEITREKGVRKPALRVTPVAGGEPIDLGPLPGPTRIEVEWFDTTRLLVCDGQGVRLVALDGTSEPLAGPGTCFVPRGAR